MQFCNDILYVARATFLCFSQQKRMFLAVCPRHFYKPQRPRFDPQKATFGPPKSHFLKSTLVALLVVTGVH
jgi:hypothetical protein